MTKIYTVIEILELSTEYLQKKGIESPRVNAELLLGDILNCKRLDLYLKFDQPLNEEELSKYRNYLSRRGNFEPYQYIIGKSEFFGKTFNVNKSVLIPRPETELLVEEIINYSKDKTNLEILDIGTGSGNIPVILALEIENSKITSIDISEEAIEIAVSNSQLFNLNGSIDFKRIDVLSDEIYLLQQKFDVIVSNPPYVSVDDYKIVQKEILDFEPKIAVTDNSDGFKFYKRIAEIGKRLLKENGKIFCEIAKDQSDELLKIFNDKNYMNIEFVRDYQNIDRILIAEKF
jgi:release factor glutamine methyltransferase